MKSTNKKTVTEVKTYHLTNEVKYDITTVNGKIKSKELRYTGAKLHDYELRPLYKEDISILQKWNPCWGDNSEYGKEFGFDWLQNKLLPKPEDIDISKIIFLQFSSHTFYTLDKEPIPVVIHGDYIEAHLNDYWYDLKKLGEYLLTNKNVVKCSEILDIPYYNAGGHSGDYYIDVLVYPTKEMLASLYETNKWDTRKIFLTPWDPKDKDYLGCRQFAIRNSYD